MYSMHQPDYKAERWHVFICYLIIVWGSCAVLMFANRLLPRLNIVLTTIILGGWLITIIVIAVMPSKGGRSHASSDFVWVTWQNNTGPSRNIPKAMGIQIISSFVTAFIFLIILFYAISDFDGVLSTIAQLPLTEIYYQATGIKAGAIGLTVISLLSLMGSVMGSLFTSSRIFWTLARDDATPFSRFFGHVSRRWKNPLMQFCTIMGCIYLGSDVAFEAFVAPSSFSRRSLTSRLCFPFLKKRASIVPGPFFIKGIPGFVINSISCAYMMIFIVFYCFPYSLPVDAEYMNYLCLIAGGLTVLLGGWWIWVRRRYAGLPVLAA
ncbi:hypothetical protein VTN00DRAFT_3433 [Thermoascus crustaceus]|uniref:uncharacterized protein n=1 Tax=Thermoascus crustaceus TaxID=5088 RepID=UPI003743917C